MGLIRFQHGIQDANGLSKDRYVNTFYGLWIGEPSPTQLTDAATAIKAFYTARSSGAVLRTYMATNLNGPGTTIKAYHVNLDPTHPPIYEEEYSFPTAAGAAENYPAEVALCLSYQSSEAPGVDIRSRRGRIYIGPLTTAAGSSGGAGGATRPNVGVTNCLLDAAQALKTQMAAAGGTWSVFSPKHLALGDVSYSYSITSVSVDDAFDTQRRRGAAPTAKTPLVLT
jgi:hypothetical protein